MRMPSSIPMASTSSIPACESKWVPIAITAPPPSRSSMVMIMAVVAFSSFGRPWSSMSASIDWRSKPKNVAVGVNHGAFVLAPFGVLRHVNLSSDG